MIYAKGERKLTVSRGLIDALYAIADTVTECSCGASLGDLLDKLHSEEDACDAPLQLKKRSEAFMDAVRLASEEPRTAFDYDDPMLGMFSYNGGKARYKKLASVGKPVTATTLGMLWVRCKKPGMKHLRTVVLSCSNGATPIVVRDTKTMDAIGTDRKFSLQYVCQSMYNQTIVDYAVLGLAGKAK